MRSVLFCILRSAIGLQRVIALVYDRVGVIPAVAVRHLMAAVGGAIVHRPVTRHDQMTNAIRNPGTGVGGRAPAGANPSRLSERQDLLDHRTVVVVGVSRRGFKHIKGHRRVPLPAASLFIASASASPLLPLASQGHLRRRGQAWLDKAGNAQRHAQFLGRTAR